MMAHGCGDGNQNGCVVAGDLFNRVLILGGRTIDDNFFEPGATVPLAQTVMIHRLKALLWQSHLTVLL
jgi:hypothetical protein